MKTEVENLLKMLGIHDYLYVDNIDDHNEGFYYNPIPTVLVRIMYSVRNNNVYDAYVYIDRHTITTYDSGLQYKVILSGRVLLTDSGEFDLDFYAKILSNLNLF